MLLSKKQGVAMSSKNFFYSNNLELTVSPYDFSFRFFRKSIGQDSESNNSSEVIDDELMVYMSPSHVKTLIPMLFTAIQAYEERFGKIPLPQEKLEEFNNLLKRLESSSL